MTRSILFVLALVLAFTSTSASAKETERNCNDGDDNDADGFIDCNDADCKDAPICASASAPAPVSSTASCDRELSTAQDWLRVTREELRACEAEKTASKASSSSSKKAKATSGSSSSSSSSSSSGSKSSAKKAKTKKETGPTPEEIAQQAIADAMAQSASDAAASAASASDSAASASAAAADAAADASSAKKKAEDLDERLKKVENGDRRFIIGVAPVAYFEMGGLTLYDWDGHRYQARGWTIAGGANLLIAGHRKFGVKEVGMTFGINLEGLLGYNMGTMSRVRGAVIGLVDITEAFRLGVDGGVSWETDGMGGPESATATAFGVEFGIIAGFPVNKGMMPFVRTGLSVKAVGHAGDRVSDQPAASFGIAVGSYFGLL